MCQSFPPVFCMWNDENRLKSFKHRERVSENLLQCWIHVCLQYVVCLVVLPMLSLTCWTHFYWIKRGWITEHQSVNKSVFPTEPVGLLSFSLCFFGGKQLLFCFFVFFLMKSNERRGKGQATCSPSLSLKQGEESRGTPIPFRPPLNPLLGLTEEEPSLICEKPRRDMELRTA